MKFKILIPVAAAAMLIGCGSEIPKNTNVTGNAANSANKANQNITNTNANGSNADQKLVFFETNETQKVECNGREVEIDQEATASKYTLTGECKKVTVDGVTNEVIVEKVGEIVVKGTSNKVTYGEGLNGKAPKISKTGVSTVVESKKVADEKKAAEEKKEAEKSKAAAANKIR